MNVKNFWDEGFSFADYLLYNQNIISTLQQSDASGYLHYYELGMTRMLRLERTFKPTEDFLQKLKAKNFKGNLLIISEGWCGDAAMILPILDKFFGSEQLRIVLRDSNHLIDHFLTNGGKSIPIVLILDENFNVINHWGPRPKTGMEMLAKHKANPQDYTSEDFHNDLQIYYTKNKGVDILNEILELL